MFDYLQKFNSLPPGLKAKVSSPSVMAAISDLEKKYQVDLAMLVMKVMTKSIAFKDLIPYFISENGLRPVIAENLTRELKERVFASVIDYLGINGGQKDLEVNNNLQDLIEKFKISLPSSNLVARFKNIINIYLKGIRNRIDTKNTLAKNIKVGGLGLNLEEIDNVIKICDRQKEINSQLGLVGSTFPGPDENKKVLADKNFLNKTPRQNQKQVIEKSNNSFSENKNNSISNQKSRLVSSSSQKAFSSSLKSSVPEYNLKHEITSGRFKELKILAPEKELALSKTEQKLKLKSSQKEILNIKTSEAKTKLKEEVKKNELPVDTQVNKPSVISRSFKKPSFWSKFNLKNKKSLKNQKNLNTKEKTSTTNIDSDLGVKNDIKRASELPSKSIITKNKVSSNQIKKEFSSPSAVLKNEEKEKIAKKSISTKLTSSDKNSEFDDLINSAQKLVSKKTVVRKNDVSSSQLPPKLSSQNSSSALNTSLNLKKSSSNLSPISNPEAANLKVLSKKENVRPAPSSAVKRPSMHDIKPLPKVMGPIEELQFLDPVNFRRLSNDPEEATNKILAKIKLLEEDGYNKMVEGVLAWRKSPVNRLYLRLGQEALNQGMLLKDYVLKKQAAKQEYLTWDEISALVALNSKLIF